MRRKKKKVLDEPKRKRINKGMKTKVSFKDILLSVRKTGGRASTVFVPKKVKAKSDRTSWKRELE